MTDYKTPGVYVEEISTLPPSVVGVSTAIPAFIGYTEKGKDKVERINTLLEYETIFGKADPSKFTATTDAGLTKLENLERSDKKDKGANFLMYYSVSLYFKNGGGSCYIVSIGDYNIANKNKDDFIKKGLDELEKIDEPTLIVLTDATTLGDEDYYEVCQKALDQCNKLGDRFAILDVLETDSDAKQFRNGVGQNYLKYGAAYYPYLQTSLNYYYKDENVKMSFSAPAKPKNLTWKKTFGANGIVVSYSSDNTAPTVKIEPGKDKKDVTFEIESKELIISNTSGHSGSDILARWKQWETNNHIECFNITSSDSETELKPLKGTTYTLERIPQEGALIWQCALGEKPNGIVVKFNDTPSIEIRSDRKVSGETDVTIGFDVSKSSNKLTIYGVSSGFDGIATTGKAIVSAWASWINKGHVDPKGFEIREVNEQSGQVDPIEKITQLEEQFDENDIKQKSDTLKHISNTNTSLYNQIKTKMTEQRVTLPPSPAIAGVYASVDRERGVWKAPANVSLAAVIGPKVKITHEEQEKLNVDPTGGKSINAIRAFNGKGTLVWGARTLAGNDNEWRYIPVRRLFITIEESIEKATAFAVFEPNDAATWLKVKAMIESYLYGLWEQGALAGPTTEAAYFVNIGLGKTMTTTDILEGRMIVEIGVAAVRPAEFIILKFTHKMQEA